MILKPRNVFQKSVGRNWLQPLLMLSLLRCIITQKCADIWNHLKWRRSKTSTYFFVSLCVDETSIHCNNCRVTKLLYLFVWSSEELSRCARGTLIFQRRDKKKWVEGSETPCIYCRREKKNLLLWRFQDVAARPSCNRQDREFVKWRWWQVRSLSMQ